jgi:hypothetical protein
MFGRLRASVANGSHRFWQSWPGLLPALVPLKMKPEGLALRQCVEPAATGLE